MASAWLFPAAWRWAIQREKSMRHPCAHPPWEVLSAVSHRGPPNNRGDVHIPPRQRGGLLGSIELRL